MDRGSPIDAEAPPQPIAVEQAIFTSLRTAMGSGYQIVCASPGLSSDEKREITRAAPSHGALTDRTDAASAVASFVLSSGRRCLLFSQNAGAEHTGRGGYRVFTYALVMDMEGYCAFWCDPLRVWDAAQGLIEAAIMGMPQKLDVAQLFPSGEISSLADVIRIDKQAAKRLQPIVNDVMNGQRLVVLGTPSSETMLAAVIWSLPLGLRAELSFSAGLRYSSARAFDLTLTEGSETEVERMGQDRGLRFFEWDKASPADDHWNGWLWFARALWLRGRFMELDRFAVWDSDLPSIVLDRVARMAKDIESLANADEFSVDRMQRESMVFKNPGPHEKLLRDILHEIAEARITQLRVKEIDERVKRQDTPAEMPDDPDAGPLLPPYPSPQNQN
jgi:GTPase-associated protein 1, N-terminal domain type 2